MGDNLLIGNNSNFKISCPICYLSFDSNRKIITLNCGHFFCNICLINTDKNSIDSESKFKCSICRAMNNSFNFLNEDVVCYFNDYVCKNIVAERDEFKQEDKNRCNEDFSFVKNYNKVFDKNNNHHNSHNKLETQDNGHEILSWENSLLILVDNIFKKEELFPLLTGDSIKEIVFNYYSNNVKELSHENAALSRDIFVKCFDYFIKEGKSITKGVTNTEKEKRQNLKRIHNFKKQLKLLDNRLLSKHLVANFLKFKEDQKRFIPCYIKSTKKLAIFDLYFLEITTYEFIDHSINKTNCIEYDQTSEKFFFISKSCEDNRFSLGNSTIWVYETKNKELKSAFTFDYTLTDHRCVIIKDYLFIIGGIKYLNTIGEYSNSIHRLDKYSYKFSGNIHELIFPRANYGINYSNNQIFLCFGVTHRGRYINNIEIVTMFDYNCTKFVSSIVNLDKEIFLKNIGVLFNSDKMIVMGGEGNNSDSNSVIYTLDVSDNFKVVDSFQSKEIVSGSFSNYGISYNSIYGIISNYTDVSEIPHVYLYSELNHKWSCHGIDIY